jgi:dTMP kinase
MSEGFFLVLEGPEGAGKTTLATALGERLRAAGHDPVLVREPGGTPAAEALRHELLHADRSWTSERELLYLTAARADLVGQIIRPSLAAGKVVVSDRYDLSTLAYQATGRTLILDLPPEVGSARQLAAGKRRDRLDREPLEFHQRVAARYREEQGPGIVHLDASLPMAELETKAWDAVLAAWPGLQPAGAR